MRTFELDIVEDQGRPFRKWDKLEWQVLDTFMGWMRTETVIVVDVGEDKVTVAYWSVGLAIRAWFGRLFRDLEVIGVD